MKKARIVLWLIIFGFFGLLLFQNQGLFFQQQGLEMDFYVIDKIVIPEQFLAVYFLCFFLSGLLITYFFGLYTKFKFNQTLKGLNQKIDALMETISKMEAEKASLKTALMEKDQKPSDPVETQLTENPSEEEDSDTANLSASNETES